jgi:hypothetical protein
MAQHTGMMSNPINCTDHNTKNDEVDIARALIGIIAYTVLIVPALSLMVVGALNLSGDYIIPIAIIGIMTGVYVTEKFYCRNIH